MIEIGKRQTLHIRRQVDFGLYLGIEDQEVLLPKKYMPDSYAIGDPIEVFVYKDHMNRPVAVSIMPTGEVGDIVGARVNHTTDFGAFVDIGLEKDVFVPKKEQSKEMITGKTYAVKILLDHMTDRLMASTKLGAFVSNEDMDLQVGEEVDLVIWHKTDLGFKVIINQRHLGLIYENEVFEYLQAGDERKGFVKRIREDNKVDISLQAQGYQAVIDSSDQIIEFLNDNGGILEIGDKSTPEEIRSYFNLSKKTFKKILGGLYKAGRIEIQDHKVILKSGRSA